MPRGDFGGRRNSFPAGAEHPMFRDLAGQQFGRWTVLALAPSDGKAVKWTCRCDCGSERVVIGASLRGGRSVSCGCFAREVARVAGDRTRTHGKSHTSTYHIWTGMVQRCHNPAAKDYPRYGAKGIAVCERWRESFEAFLADMGERPRGKTLDRFPNGAGNYEPDNCRWATPAEQSRNSAAAKMVTIDGRTQCVTDWCKELGLSPGTYASRFQRGWDPVRALTTVPDRRFNWRGQ